MKKIEFVKNAIMDLDTVLLDELKGKLSPKYIKYSILNQKDVTKEEFAEKLVDYIGKVECEEHEGFYKILYRDVTQIKKMVGGAIAKGSRAEKYYFFACKKIEKEDFDFSELVDFLRIMLCLYTQKTNSKKKISEIDFSINHIIVDKVISKIKKEEKPGIDLKVLKFNKENYLNTKYSYTDGSMLIVIIYVVYYYIKNNVIEGECENGNN